MFKAERQGKIIDILNAKSKADVNSLSTMFGVSVVTIRSDLEELEKSGFLKKIHGGAIKNNKFAEFKTEAMVDNAYAESITKPNIMKSQVGKIAAKYVNGGEWIFIGEGGTCYNMAVALAEKSNVNIITNNLHVAIALQKNHSNNVVVAGGNLYHDRLCVGGELFSDCIAGLNVSKAFLGVAGVDINAGYTLSNVGENNIFQAVRKISKELVIITTNAKFDKAGFIAAGDLSIAQTFITNEPVSLKYLNCFNDYNVKVITG